VLNHFHRCGTTFIGVEPVTGAVKSVTGAVREEGCTGHGQMASIRCSGSDHLG